jgi:hypothetical protein
VALLRKHTYYEALEWAFPKDTVSWLGSIKRQTKTTMNRLVLPVLDAHDEKGLNPRTLKGLTVIEETRGEFKWNNYYFPEFGPARYCYSVPQQLVLPLGGRRYKVSFKSTSDGSGIPTGGEITFVLTDEPETTYSTLKRGNPPVTAFGQPVFIQNTVTPSLDGRCASNLMTLETGWGDAGNINLLCALDEKGVPAKVWFEASCC